MTQWTKEAARDLTVAARIETWQTLHLSTPLPTACAFRVPPFLGTLLLLLSCFSLHRRVCRCSSKQRSFNGKASLSTYPLQGLTSMAGFSCPPPLLPFLSFRVGVLFGLRDQPQRRATDCSLFSPRWSTFEILEVRISAADWRHRAATRYHCSFRVQSTVRRASLLPNLRLTAQRALPLTERS